MLRRSLGRGLPEALAALQIAVQGRPLPQVIEVAFLLRLAWVLAELLHGAGHSLAQRVVDRDPQALRLANLLEHRSLQQLLGQLLPFAPIGPLSLDSLPVPWLEVGQAAPWKVRIKASGGLLLQSTVLLLALGLLAGGAYAARVPFIEPLRDLLCALIVTNAWQVLTSRTDHRAMLSGVADWFHCGNFGFVTVPPLLSSGALLPERAIHLYRRMGHETELRGTQAGGGLVMAQDRHGQDVFVGHKVVNAKRGDLTHGLEAGFHRTRQLATLRGIRPNPSCLLACWHYRFGTSGPPAVRETHWQEWTPARRRTLHRWVDGSWRRAPAVVHHRITHNGDFEAFELGGTLLDVAGALGPWLAQTLGQPVPARVDSARIAGMMDLLICQGTGWQRSDGGLSSPSPMASPCLPGQLWRTGPGSWRGRFSSSSRSPSRPNPLMVAGSRTSLSASSPNARPIPCSAVIRRRCCGSGSSKRSTPFCTMIRSGPSSCSCTGHGEASAWWWPPPPPPISSC